MGDRTESVERLSADLLSDRAALEARIERGRPFILVGAVRGAPASLERFVEVYGDHVVRVSSRSFYLPLSTEQCRVRDYVREVARGAPARLHHDDAPIPYVFHDDLGLDAMRQGAGATDNPFDIARACPLPELLGQVLWGKRLAAIRIALGPRFSHAGLHTHGVAINQLAFGSKRWFLYPSQMGERQVLRLHALISGARAPSPQLYWLEHFHPLGAEADGDIVEALRAKAEALSAQGTYDIPPSETWTEPFLAEEVRGIEARQQAGDIMFVPEHWAHAIVNEAWSLSIIYELALERR